MPLLSLFSRNKKHPNTLSPASTDDTSSLGHSPTAEYVLPNALNTPSSPNGNALFPTHKNDSVSSTIASSSSKLHLPFRRKRSELSDPPISPTSTHSILPSSSYTSRTTTGPDLADLDSRPIRNPPPSRSAIFVAYANGALSTRSLPNDAASLRYHSFSSAASDTSPPLHSMPEHPKPPKQDSRTRGFFSWSKPSQKTRAKTNQDENQTAESLPSPATPPASNTPSSFNLKSFRHIRAPSPPMPLPTIPAVRSRGGSNASDASQRISVAAFREAQLRRSTADSPVPSPRELDPYSSSRVDLSSPNHSTPRSTPELHARYINVVPTPAPGQAARRSTATLSSAPRLSAATVSTYRGSGSGYVETSDDDDEEEEESADTDDRPVKSVNKGKERERVKVKAHSEIGHGYTPRPAAVFSPPSPGTRALSAYALDVPDQRIQTPPRSQSSLSVYGNGGTRPRASLSTSALVRDEDAKRASFVANMNVKGPSQTKHSHTHSRSYSNTLLIPSSPSSPNSSDEDDAPLATLMSPRRPGSDISHASSSTKPRKPLIDINSLTSPSSASGSGDGRPLKFLSPVNSISLPTGRRSNHQVDSATPPINKGSGESVTFGTTLQERLARVVQSPTKQDAVAVKEDGNGRSTDGRAGPPKLGHERRISSEGSRDSRDWVTEVDAGWVARSVSEDVKEGKEKGGEDRIIPTPIRQRVPPSSFSVTSRPQHPRPKSPSADPTPSSPSQQRPRSTTLVPLSTGTLSPNAIAPITFSSDREQASGITRNTNAGTVRPRSTTLTSLGSTSTSGTKPAFLMPTKPFAVEGGRRDSPASSTGDSSSGRIPLTPKDGSDLSPGKGVGAGRNVGWGSGVSGLGVGKEKGRGGHVKRPSLNFEEDMEKERERRSNESPGLSEMRRRERRRSEAKAAIELGNVINGPGPIIEDEDEDEKHSIPSAMSGRMSMMNMGMGGPSPMSGPMGYGPSVGWNGPAWSQQGPTPPMLSPAQFMMPPTDPNFFAAHQQAMMVAKQAYQMAVAQQALAAAGEEWERGSSVGFGGGSVYGGMASPAGFGMGMGMGMSQGWGSGPMFSGGPRSVHGGFSGAQSEYASGWSVGGDAGWSSSKSVYGEAFGPSNDRGRGGRPVVPPLPPSGGANGRGRGGGRMRTSSVPASVIGSPGRNGPGKNGNPPSSWKATSGL